MSRQGVSRQILSHIAMWLLAVACGALIIVTEAAADPQRVAFVVGNGTYAKASLRTAMNDAGLVAKALRESGFEIVEGADLALSDLRGAYRRFIDRLEAGGPDAVGVIYFSGYGFEFDGENYLLPVDARLAADGDIATEAVRLSEFLDPLGALPARAKIVVLDAARPHAFAPRGAVLVRGLGTPRARPDMLIALAAAPGTIADDGAGPYGAYGLAIAEMLREPGLELDVAFTRIRARTHQATLGAQTPWHVSAVAGPVVLAKPSYALQSASGLPSMPIRRPPRPMRDVGPDLAYALAIEQDSLAGYVEFVGAYPTHAYAPRIWSMIRARRETLAWHHALSNDTPEAYWTYLRLYPRGLYVLDAERRLRRHGARFEPPETFAPAAFADLPPPLPAEPETIVDVLDGPPPPAALIAPPRTSLAALPPPQSPEPGLLPDPGPLPPVAAEAAGASAFGAVPSIAASPPVRKPPVTTGAVPQGPTPAQGRRPAAAGASVPQGTGQPVPGQKPPRAAAATPPASPTQPVQARRPAGSTVPATGSITPQRTDAPPSAGRPASRSPSPAGAAPPAPTMQAPRPPQVAAPARPAAPKPPGGPAQTASPKLAPAEAARRCETVAGIQVCRGP